MAVEEEVVALMVEEEVVWEKEEDVFTRECAER